MTNGLCLRLIGLPRQQQNQQYDRSYIEKTNTRITLLMAFGTIVCGSLHSQRRYRQFNRRKSETLRLNQYQRGQQAVREAFIICNQVKTGGVPSSS
ncbi:hypothetical protein KCP78_06740 [Salmonella enterica subsp. enterica]|nr:hypothetical protein KCP78_06740 [Salmonella enterica subsp. enterica]